jgi:hypothetical protein
MVGAARGIEDRPEQGERSLGLIDYPAPGYVVAQPVLFLEAA